MALNDKTIFDKIWDAHIVHTIPSGPSILYIDRHYIHEVTSPQAFEGLKKRGVSVFRPGRTFAVADHNVPTRHRHLSLSDESGREQIEMLGENCQRHGIKLFSLDHPQNGIVHVTGPELGITLPGMTVVCGDSHTSTHGALGSIAFGIGTSEVEMVLASQALLQHKPRQMRINVEGELQEGVTAKDLMLHIISTVSTECAAGYFVEYTGPGISKLTMDSRMTVCNMSIEMGARGGLVAPDNVTFDYVKGKEYAPSGEDWDRALDRWEKLPTDAGAFFDRELSFDARKVEPMITYGTNPAMAVETGGMIPEIDRMEPALRAAHDKALRYMGFSPGEKVKGKKVDYVFLGSCTNGRIEDLRAFASLVKGRKKAEGVTVWIVPGSMQVRRQACDEGVAKILEDAGFEMRYPGCSACLAMNEDKIPRGKYAVATSNRNFEGRQGPGARTMLAGPLTAAAAAITGKITDPRELQQNQL